ncbi:hypothetical protein GH714_004525 [Hevea brasiliensis]|uniref:Uncharacterized protein n=1 Tax=Hevea brasiliensis TaxID=3981 RepID=A0A6A6KGU3_HEVBR|nr:hypothetical protein GH714_004466 [Hevea brasiliensis]KAF2288121.1 hypothetical protein GH714_004525 [Hevea brasiliensis]
MEEDSLYLQLHKLSAIKSEEALDHILTTLWKTRRTGLCSPEKSHIQSLLSLLSLSEVDPGALPRLKSMTWTMENCNSAAANRVAIISLKVIMLIIDQELHAYLRDKRREVM